ncbi:MAG TPA: hypothetical protein VNQ77_13660 [Frankiaceae bacterium]|nr:hypothetical protein [Frankiaceae bacterium]
MTVATAWVVLRHEIDKARRHTAHQAQFAIEHFDYTAFWATEELKHSGHVPAGLAVGLRQHSATLREAFARDAERIHALLPVAPAKRGYGEDPLKALHLLFARLETGMTKNDIEAADLLAGMCASAYLRALLGLDATAPENLGVIHLVYAADRADRDIQNLLRILVDNGPSRLKARILAA